MHMPGAGRSSQRPRRFRRLRAYVWRALAGLLLWGPACAVHAADTPETAYAAWARGDWAEARRCGQALATAEGYALSALAWLTEAGRDPEQAQQQTAVKAAIEDAQRALDRDPDNVTALLQAASAYGFRARWSESFGDVRAARDYLERARELSPDNALVLAGQGYWHGRTVLAAGGFWGGLFFGADLDDAIGAFETALALAPDNPSIRGGFGRLLLRFGKPRLTARGLDELRRALKTSPRTALDRRVLEAAESLLATAETGASPRELAARATQLAPFSGGENG